MVSFTVGIDLSFNLLCNKRAKFYWSVMLNHPHSREIIFMNHEVYNNSGYGDKGEPLDVIPYIAIVM